ncbi:hypothetical protein [Metallosphaera yellowstonensis]|uniref:hypothetical protein n=1 Tax=Metallosphaera yellowstonensis TaxID=1111107 RepID=UPI003CCAE9D4
MTKCENFITHTFSLLVFITCGHLKTVNYPTKGGIERKSLTFRGSNPSLKRHTRYTEHTTTCPVCRKEFANTDSTLDHVCKKHNICVG